MKRNAKELLQLCGADVDNVFINLGLEQEFFAIPTSAYNMRNDLRYSGRTLIGQMGAKTQEFSDHYYAKIPYKIEDILNELEQEMLAIGIPLKAKHNEVAINQFEFACIYQEAGHAIDRNLFVMEILKEAFARKGYTVLLHEKPFGELNGSGKHANYSINYNTKDGKLKNLYSIPKEEGQDMKLFKLFVLLTLSAIKRNNELYFAAIAVPGNEIRLGGHEAPPRIISAYLGQTIDALLEGRPLEERKNLKDSIWSLTQDLYQEDTDRNRTSPFAYTGHKFEFRALGSTQNPAYPMSVIAATIANECKLAVEKMKNGMTLDQLLVDLKEYSKEARFEGNGYSKEWAVEAEKRGLYVNRKFPDVYNKLEKALRVFVDIGACSEREIISKVETTKEEYVNTVHMEHKAFLHLARQQIIPRGFKYLQLLRFSSTKVFINKFAEDFQNLFDKGLRQVEDLETYEAKEDDTLATAVTLRQKIQESGDTLNEIVKFLEKDDKFPDLEDFLRL